MEEKHNFLKKKKKKNYLCLTLRKLTKDNKGNLKL